MTPDGAPAAAAHRSADFEEHVRFEALLADLSSRFINLPAAEVDAEIHDALRRVCELLGLDLAVLWQASGAPPETFTPTHVHSVQDDLPRPQPIHEEHYPWYVRQVLSGRMVAVSSLDDLPAEAALDREYGRALGIKSNLCLPFSAGGGRPLGALAFNTLRVPRDWPDALVKRLQLVAQIFANALARRRADEVLRESQARVSLAADAADAGLWTLDFQTGDFWATDRGRELFGYAPDEAITMERFEASVHPADWDRVRDAIDRAARDGEPVRVEYRITHARDGRVRWIASQGRPRFAPTGAPESLMGVSIDVTERRRAEDALRVSEARLSAGADLAGLAFYEVDFAGRVAFVDDRFRAICGLPPDRERDLQPLEFWMERLHPDDRPGVLDQRQALHTGRIDCLSIEYRFLHPADGEKWLHHAARVAERDASGHTIRSFGVLRDITIEKRAEESLRRSFAEIERLKDRLEAESDYLKAEIRVVHARSEITGRSPAIQKVLREAEQVAPTDATVLIRGETGTGKELLAQAIHRLSLRARRLLVNVNCAALPSGLVESELFGREKGAFTGSLARQVGRVEVADQSTLFLDEVGELPPDVQVKLLRVLQNGEFERLGSPRTLKVNVRLVAATNRDLAEEVRRGRFCEDLYHRLNVFPIHMPPLRERPQDIPMLVWDFLAEFTTRMGKKITQVPRATMEALQGHAWPGNVRELRNVIEHGVIITAGDTLRVALPGDAVHGASSGQRLADLERAHILRVLESTGWRIKGPRGAATLLGLKPSTLYGRMKKLGIRTRR